MSVNQVFALFCINLVTCAVTWYAGYCCGKQQVYGYNYSKPENVVNPPMRSDEERSKK